MPNSYFQFKQFTIHQDRTAMKVTTDACLFGAWVSEQVRSKKSEVRSVLDIGTGTGLLSLMLAQKNPDLTIETIEIDNGAFQQAKENVASSPFPKRIKTILGDIRVFLGDKKYDLIISNPPFYENELKSETKEKNVAHHGEHLSLTELFISIKNNLVSEGKFFILLPYKRYNETRALFLETELSLTEVVLVRQSIKHDFFRVMMSGKKSSGPKSEINMNEISIWNDNQHYTEEFIRLLEDYYLYL